MDCYRELIAPAPLNSQWRVFNPYLTLRFSGYYFLCGNKCRSLSLTTTGIASCARPTDFPSAHILRFTFYSIKGGEKDASIFMKTKAWTLLSMSLPKEVRETLPWTETHVKIAQSPTCSLKEIIFASPRQSLYGSGLGRKWARGFSKHRVSCPSI